MTRSGGRATVLRTLLRASGRRELPAKPPAPRLSTLPSDTAVQVKDLYRCLGGILDEPKLAPGAWDFVFDDGLLLELDENFHFNRYRVATFDAPWSAQLPWAPPYREYSTAHERRSGGGKRWTKPSAEKMFGPADPFLAFTPNGSPRWKQRALYDSMKDAAAAAGQVQLARISVYDQIDGVQLDAVLQGRATVDLAHLDALIAERTVSPT